MLPFFILYALFTNITLVSHMKGKIKMHYKVCLILIILFFSPTLLAQSNFFGIESLSWLSGTWECKKQDYIITEQWMKPGGNTLFATNRTVKYDKTVAFEFLQIKTDKSGKIILIALPSRQKMTVFKMAKIDRNEIVFENPRHDFPQRIIYKLMENGSLFARVELLNKKKGSDFIFKKIINE